jgi:hypothetical protein
LKKKIAKRGYRSKSAHAPFQILMDENETHQHFRTGCLARGSGGCKLHIVGRAT